MSASQRRKVLFVSYAHAGSMALRIFASILKERYDLAFLFIEDLTYRRSSFKEPDVRADWVAGFCKDFDYVLFSTTHYHADLTFRLADSIKKTNPKAWVVLGGPLAVAYPAPCLEHADYVCVFEGENIQDLLSYLDENDEPKSIGNFVCKAEDIGRSLTWVEDLDTLPLPDYHVGEHYWYTTSGIVPTTRLPDFLYYQTLRGCIFNCTFCANASLNRLKSIHKAPLVRFKSIATVMQELGQLRDQLPGLKRVDFSADDNFLARSVKDIEAFSSEYDKKIGLPLVIVGDPRSPDFDKKIKALGKVNSLYSIGFGIQTGSEEFNRRIYKRHQKNDEILRQYEIMRGVLSKNVRIVFDIIYGHPKESPSDLLETINFMLKLKGAHFSVFSFTPVPTSTKPLPEGRETRRSYSMVDSQQLERFAFYYFLIFLIKHLNNYHLSFLLPNQIKPTRLFRLLDNALLARLYGSFVRLSIWAGLTRTKLARPHSGLA